ncbi:helix-turn-helix transcriptional regulator [Streptomyces sp. SCL15-6]|uniref:helix-turn-helix domain-containing protein n=1 Tax=Streptomyces sp. SCL15-6 TaxID=2967222 RepID=UPI0029665223|nr:helix-turn-helix transcriptional regulator [Streptomyces sp. SCL15-6]
MPPPSAKRGRPANYCGRACRQAAYRERQRRRGDSTDTDTGSRALPEQSLEQLQLLELAQDTHEELRHLLRLLSNSHRASAADILEHSVKVQRRMEAVTAGVVLMARRRRIPWESLGKILSLSPETARHSYHERLVQRRLDDYAPHLAPAQPQAAGPPAADEADDPVPTLQPDQPSLRATNQLSPILSRLQIASGIPLRQLGLRVQVSASYLSRVLSGEKFPTWELTEKIALVLGADTDAVQKVWQDERNRHGIRPRASRQQSPPADPESGTSLAAALRTLYQRAACPSAHSVAVATGDLISADDVRRFLHGERAGSWEEVSTLIRALDGEPSFFRPHWQEAHESSSPPLPTIAETPTNRLNRLLSAFGDSLHDARTLAPSPALSVRRRALRRRLAAQNTRPAL